MAEPLFSTLGHNIDAGCGGTIFKSKNAIKSDALIEKKVIVVSDFYAKKFTAAGAIPHLALMSHSNGRANVVLHDKADKAHIVTPKAYATFIKTHFDISKLKRLDILACSLGGSSFGADVKAELGEGVTVYTANYTMAQYQGILCLQKEFRGYEASWDSLKEGDLVKNSFMSNKASYDKVVTSEAMFKQD